MEWKTLDEPATKEVFQDVFISPLGEHVNTWTSISEDKIIRQIPRHAITHKKPSIEGISIQIALRSYGHKGPKDQPITEAFKTALNAP